MDDANFNFLVGVVIGAVIVNLVVLIYNEISIRNILRKKNASNRMG